MKASYSCRIGLASKLAATIATGWFIPIVDIGYGRLDYEFWID